MREAVAAKVTNNKKLRAKHRAASDVVHGSECVPNMLQLEANAFFAALSKFHALGRMHSPHA